ncbi:response regulator [Catellatospora chokoriensis]|uniref:DNA-binding response regulator n=1 Tax=Catellatospora chokoriensis TaxID=310353 RepID=A0A8J3NP41_9ACTN|nr:response regulator transcription factor [Catellatospora chokoriensis]GIF87822.1 DNA-binding response regulator [Catellatospora chokoriensis]
MIRVAVVDDQELVRAGFRALLDADAGLDVVGEAGDGAAAVELARSHRLDVMLMDIRMPGVNGIEATRRIRALAEPPEVLILTTFDTDENAFDALEAGAAGFLVKDTPPTQLLDAIRAAARGGTVISPVTTRRLVDRLIAARIVRDRPVPAGLDLLTDREREVLGLVARGRSNREISALLQISELTTKTHVSRMLTKLGLSSRVQAAALAYETGLVRPGE